MYLLVTDVVSELRNAPGGKADPNVVAWAERVRTDETYVSVVTILELELGVLLIERRDAAQGSVLRQWLDDRIIPGFADRTLRIDTTVARRCAGLHVPDPRQERDALIAATALVHSMVVVTRNVRDFAGIGVAIHNPWLSSPPRVIA